MRTEDNREKQLYCRLFYANDRLQSLRILYNETHDDRLKGRMTKEAKEMKKVREEI